MPRTAPLISAFAASHLAVTVRSPRSMIARCGLPTHLSAARPHAELAGAARPIRRSQRRRDPRAPSPGRPAAPTQPTPDADLIGPRSAQRAEQTAPYPAAPAAARFTQNPAALACPPPRPPLDLPRRQPGRPPTPQPIRARLLQMGPREPHLGLPTHPRRTGRPRPSDRWLHGVEDLKGGRQRPRTAAIRTDLAIATRAVCRHTPGCGQIWRIGLQRRRWWLRLIFTTASVRCRRPWAKPGAQRGVRTDEAQRTPAVEPTDTDDCREMIVPRTLIILACPWFIGPAGNTGPSPMSPIGVAGYAPPPTLQLLHPERRDSASRPRS